MVWTESPGSLEDPATTKVSWGRARGRAGRQEGGGACRVAGSAGGRAARAAAGRRTPPGHAVHGRLDPAACGGLRTFRVWWSGCNAALEVYINRPSRRPINVQLAPAKID